MRTKQRISKLQRHLPLKAAKPSSESMLHPTHSAAACSWAACSWKSCSFLHCCLTQISTPLPQRSLPTTSETAGPSEAAPTAPAPHQLSLPPLLSNSPLETSSPQLEPSCPCSLATPLERTAAPAPRRNSDAASHTSSAHSSARGSSSACKAGGRPCDAIADISWDAWSPSVAAAARVVSCNVSVRTLDCVTGDSRPKAGDVGVTGVGSAAGDAAGSVAPVSCTIPWAAPKSAALPSSPTSCCSSSCCCCCCDGDTGDRCSWWLCGLCCCE